jgi:hypothetical protein
VVDPSTTADRPANSSWLGGTALGKTLLGRIDNELFAGLVDLNGALQQLGTADPEPPQHILHRPRQRVRLIRHSPLPRRPLARRMSQLAGATLPPGANDGPGRYQHPAGRAHGDGHLADLGGCFGRGVPGVLVTRQQAFDPIRQRRGERPGNINRVRQRPGSHQEPVTTGSGPQPLALSPGPAWSARRTHGGPRPPHREG